MDGILAGECYRQAKDEGCNIEVVWHDGDSSSQKSVEEILKLIPGGCLSVGVMLEGLMRTV